MKLSQAVAQAVTPDELEKVLEEVARRYVYAREQETNFALIKAEIRDACVAALKRLEVNSHDWELDGKRFRAQKYPITKVVPTPDLVKLLYARGLSECVTIEYRLNDTALDVAVRRNQIGIEEIRQLSEVRTTEGFRINQLKDRPQESGEEPVE